MNALASSMAPTRPSLRWHGGKWLLAPWVISHMPRHRCYVEPFGGAASVLLRKPRASAEVFNDLDADLVTLFRVLRDEKAAEHLHQQLTLTPFARAEYAAAFKPTDEAVERARRLVVRSFMGYGSDASRTDKVSGFRGTSRRSKADPNKKTAAADWAHYPECVPALAARFRGVVIEQRDALECMACHDAPDTLHYVDPPYLPSTRQVSHRHNGYAHELTHADHDALLSALTRLSGMVMLSGYPSRIYDETLPGWTRVSVGALAAGAQRRTEVLWLNPAAAAAAPQRQLFP